MKKQTSFSFLFRILAPLQGLGFLLLLSFSAHAQIITTIVGGGTSGLGDGGLLFLVS